jgi:hypothetical protein
MITHDSTFETLALAPIKQTNTIVARQFADPYGYYDDGLTWASSDLLMSVKVDAVGQFLGTVTKKAVVKLLGIVTGYAVNDMFQVRVGIYNNDPSVSGFDYVSQGFFIVDNIAYDYESGSTTITMYDHMWSAQHTSYTDTTVSTGFTYPATVSVLAQQMASAIGVDLMAGFSSLPNASYNILVDPYLTISNATLATVIQEIAQTTGTTARITNTTLTFSQYSVSSENLDSSALKTLKIGKPYGPVTSVVLGRIPQNDNVVIARTSPLANTISSINTTTDLITVTSHGMSNGNLVQIESSGTLPAPLVAGVNYYVYTAGNTNTFALTPTYADGIAGTNIIDLTTPGTGTIILSHLTTQEVQINNNQIMDDDRITLLPNLYSKLVGIGWNEVKSSTVGLGWHEVGDVIQFTQGTSTYKAFLSEVHLSFEGGIKEDLVSVIPDVATINYQTAGGVLKTIYNTEIKVDKQGNSITSVVSQQDIFATQTTNNFTQLYQDLSNILLTIQKSGGGNLALNSVGFATEAGVDNASVGYTKLSFWDYNPSYQISTHGAVSSFSSSESQNAGGTSGQAIQMSGASIYISQRINVAANTPLSFALRVKNAIGTGSATITISNTTDTFTIPISSATAYIWDELKLENFVSSMSWVDVKIQVTSATAFLFTDLRLLYGTTLQGWVQSSSEILSTNVQFSKLGMKIFDNVHDTETQVTYNEFSTRRKADNVVLFEADDSGVVTNDLSIKGSTTYVSGVDNVVKQVTIPASSALAGIAFIKAVS